MLCTENINYEDNKQRKSGGSGGKMLKCFSSKTEFLILLCCFCFDMLENIRSSGLILFTSAPQDGAFSC